VRGADRTRRNAARPRREEGQEQEGRAVVVARIVGPFKLFEGEPFAASASKTPTGVTATSLDAFMPIFGAQAVYLNCWNTGVAAGFLTVNAIYAMQGLALQEVPAIQPVVQDFSKITGVSLANGGSGH